MTLWFFKKKKLETHSPMPFDIWSTGMVRQGGVVRRAIQAKEFKSWLSKAIMLSAVSHVQEMGTLMSPSQGPSTWHRAWPRWEHQRCYAIIQISCFVSRALGGSWDNKEKTQEVRPFV